MSGSELALSLLADLAVAAMLLGLLVSLQRLSRHPALAGAVTYGVGHLAYSLGSSVYSIIKAHDALPLQLPFAATGALLAAITGAALMVDGLGGLLESPRRRAIRRAAAGLAGSALAGVLLAPLAGGDPLKLAADIVDVLAVAGLSALLWRHRGRPPQRMPASVAAVSLGVLTLLYSDPLTVATGVLPSWVPPYEHWVWLDLALWNTVNFCVLMLASFRALVAFAHRSRIDPLTQVMNREGLANERAALALRHPGGVALAVVALDIDHFKRVNDTHGHAGGDAYLAAFAALLRAKVRGSDLVVRWGGEEFVVILVGAPPPVARRIAESIRAATERLEVGVGVGEAMIRTTTSAGVASGAAGTELDALMAAADAALYAAKRAGRNRVHVAGEADATPPPAPGAGLSR